MLGSAKQSAGGRHRSGRRRRGVLRHSAPAIQDGGVASVELGRRLFEGGELPGVEQAQLRGARQGGGGTTCLTLRVRHRPSPVDANSGEKLLADKGSEFGR